jgi:UDP-glucose 4-epimerase
MATKTVLFTGGAGFIGSHVIPLLLERDYRIRIMDNMFRGDRDKMAALVAGGNVELID